MTDFTLGQRVTFSNADVLERATQTGPGYRTRKVWRTPLWKKPGESRGVVVGIRTLSNGRVTYNYDEPTEYTANEWFKAALIATDLLRKPVFVRVEDVKPELCVAVEWNESENLAVKVAEQIEARRGQANE